MKKINCILIIVSFMFILSALNIKAIENSTIQEEDNINTTNKGDDTKIYLNLWGCSLGFTSWGSYDMNIGFYANYYLGRFEVINHKIGLGIGIEGYNTGVLSTSKNYMSRENVENDVLGIQNHFAPYICIEKGILPDYIGFSNCEGKNINFITCDWMIKDSGIDEHAKYNQGGGSLEALLGMIFAGPYSRGNIRLSLKYITSSGYEDAEIKIDPFSEIIIYISLNAHGWYILR